MFKDKKSRDYVKAGLATQNILTEFYAPHTKKKHFGNERLFIGRKWTLFDVIISKIFEENQTIVFNLSILENRRNFFFYTLS